MRKILRKILEILDGTPAVYGKHQAGQSMVELALVTPLLIILLAGLVEIGWFANNYLSLLDVTRAGARRATVLVDDQSPVSTAWKPEFTYVPQAWLSDPADIPYQMPYTTADPVAEEADRQRYRYDSTTFACNPGTLRLFYNEVICTMVASLDPLRLRRDNGIDDIIVSGYSVEMVDASKYGGVWLPPYPGRPINGDVPQMVVVGRYPTNANECDVTETSPGFYSVAPRESRDPFDFNASGNVDDTSHGNGTSIIDGADDFNELPGYDDTGATIVSAEKQVGFSLYGNHKIPGTLCVGSEWTMRQVEDMMNLPLYSITDNAARALMPGQGIALVELYWQHEMLLKIPVLSPVFQAVGNPNGNMTVYVWAAFPLPSVEPYIIFPS